MGNLWKIGSRKKNYFLFLDEEWIPIKGNPVRLKDFEDVDLFLWWNLEKREWNLCEARSGLGTFSPDSDKVKLLSNAYAYFKKLEKDPGSHSRIRDAVKMAIRRNGLSPLFSLKQTLQVAFGKAVSFLEEIISKSDTDLVTYRGGKKEEDEQGFVISLFFDKEK